MSNITQYKSVHIVQSDTDTLPLVITTRGRVYTHFTEIENGELTLHEVQHEDA